MSAIEKKFKLKTAQQYAQEGRESIHKDRFERQQEKL